MMKRLILGGLITVFVMACAGESGEQPAPGVVPVPSQQKSAVVEEKGEPIKCEVGPGQAALLKPVVTRTRRRMNWIERSRKLRAELPGKKPASINLKPWPQRSVSPTITTGLRKT
jgi:hypothetical protein